MIVAATMDETMGMGAKEIAAILEAEIRQGRLLPGARLPTHRDLAFRHGVALNTASSAMRLLEARGLVVGVVGRGSFVRAPGHVDAASFRIEEGASGIIDLSRNVMSLAALGVKITPGAAFGIGNAPNSVRLALGAPVDRNDLERALRIVANAL